MAKNLRKPKTGVKNPAVAALLLSFGCGVGMVVLDNCLQFRLRIYL